MASMRDIKRRIKSVNSTQQITNAMYLIASAKLRRAKEEWDRTEPYFSMLRGEIKKEQKQYYGLPAANGLPDLASEGALLRWGKQVMEGERQRTAHGGIPIYNPTIARVKVYYDLFVESMERQKGTQRETANALRALAALRGKADGLILEIWNRIEDAFSGTTPNEARLDRCREYGVVYYYRTGGQHPAEPDE